MRTGDADLEAIAALTASGGDTFLRNPGSWALTGTNTIGTNTFGNTAGTNVGLGNVDNVTISSSFTASDVTKVEP